MGRRTTKITIVETIGETPKIDPAKVPDYAWDSGCRILQQCIRQALADPVLRKDFEDWKARRASAAGNISREETSA